MFLFMIFMEMDKLCDIFLFNDVGLFEVFYVVFPKVEDYL
jgi:hypothetical protein